ncbi:hypothetical protein ACJX0J_031830, partial [Zea mays]
MTGGHVGIKVNDQDGQFDGLIPHLYADDTALISGVRTSFGIKRIVTFNCLGVESSHVYVTISQVTYEGKGYLSRENKLDFGKIVIRWLIFVEIFMWYLIKGVQSETGMSIQHLFIDCHFANRNDLVFNKTTMLTSLQTVAMHFSNRIHRLCEEILPLTNAIYKLYMIIYDFVIIIDADLVPRV